MIGAIIGDVVGSRFEKKEPPVSKAFDLLNDKSIFTDDTILSVAIADAIMNGKPYDECIKEYFKRYPYAGYGGAFKSWAVTANGVIANSFGNGSAMRVSPVAWAFDTLEDVMVESERTTYNSHNHPDAILGAQTIAASIFIARKFKSKEMIREFAEKRYNVYDSVSENRPKFSSACAITVPQSIWAFLESESFEDSIRKAIMIGGDADTLASMTGAISHAFYGMEGIDYGLVRDCFSLLTEDLFKTSKEFIVKYVDESFDLEPTEKETLVQQDFGFLFV